MTLYTILCPKCKILEKKLSAAGFEYDVCTDQAKMEDLGIEELPVLEVEGILMDFKEALNYIAQHEKG